MGSPEQRDEVATEVRRVTGAARHGVEDDQGRRRSGAVWRFAAVDIIRSDPEDGRGGEHGREQ